MERFDVLLEVPVMEIESTTTATTVRCCISSPRQSSMNKTEKNLIKNRIICLRDPASSAWSHSLSYTLVGVRAAETTAPDLSDHLLPLTTRGDVRLLKFGASSSWYLLEEFWFGLSVLGNCNFFFKYCIPHRDFFFILKKNLLKFNWNPCSLTLPRHDKIINYV